MVVYIAGLVLLLAVISLLIVQMYTIYRDVIVSVRADRVGISLVDRMIKEIRTGQTINLSESSFGTPTGSLSLETPDGGTTITKLFSVDNERVTYQEEGGSAEFVTSDDIHISRFYFTQIVTPVSQAIRIEVGINYETRKETRERLYTGVAVLRRSYD